MQLTLFVNVRSVIDDLNSMLNALSHRIARARMCAEPDPVFMSFVYTCFGLFVAEIAVHCVANLGNLTHEHGPQLQFR